MATIQTNLTCELQKAVKVQYLDGNLFSQDAQANQINVAVFDNGEPATISGTVTADIIRADGGTVAATGGTIEDNVASITMPSAAYAIPGVCSIVIKLTSSGVTTSIAAVVANVYESSTDTVIDPGTIIPSVTTLISAIETAVASIPADYSSLWTSLAPAFNPSKSGGYSVGEYCTNDGKMYICINPHTGSWTAGDFTQVNIGSELSSLKSAFDYNGHLNNGETIQKTKSAPGTSGTSVKTFESVLLLAGYEYVFKSEGSSLNGTCSSVIYDLNSTSLKVIGDINGSNAKQVTYTPSSDVLIKVGHYCYATSGSITDTIYMVDSAEKKNNTIGNTDVLSLLWETPVEYIAKYDGYVDSNGTISSGSAYRSTEYVDVSKFSHIAYKRIGITASSAGTGMAFYDANKTKVSFVGSMASQSANGYLSSYNYVQVPDNAVYARFTTYIDTSTYGNFALFGIPKVKYINVLKSYLEKGTVTLSQDDFVVNQWSTRGMEPNANRLSNKILIPVAKGDQIMFSTNSLYVFMGIYDTGMTNRTTIQDFTLASDGKILSVNMDGLLNITLKNSSGSAISVSDYDATIKIQNRYFVEPSEKKYQYDYYGEKIQLNGFSAKEILQLNTNNGAPNDIAIYGNYLLMGTNRSPNAGKLVIFDMSDGTQKSVLSVSESNHFNSMAFSGTKYDNSDLFPLLYAETEDANGLYLVIRISALDSYEVVKKYRFPETIYGTAPQIYWDFEHGVAYGICLKPTGRAAKYNFFKFDCSNETQNEDGTYTPAVVFESEIENPGVRQGGQYYKNRIYLMTTTTAYDHPTVIVINCDSIYPSVVSKLPNLPFVDEGEGLSISTDIYGNPHLYISNSYKVYELEL